MPLIKSRATAAAGNIANLLLGIQGDLESSARKLNAITHEYTGLGNDDLAEFANDLGPTELLALVSAQEAQGHAFNSIIAGLNQILASVGLPQGSASVDVRPLSEKLADQYRKMEPDESGVFSVIDLPRPEPEPVIEEL